MIPTVIDEATFEHNGFKCKITQRPDLCYLYAVYGHRELDNMDFVPFFTRRILFEQNLTFEQIRDASIAIMDGTFKGVVERHGNYNLYAGIGA